MSHSICRVFRKPLSKDHQESIERSFLSRIQGQMALPIFREDQMVVGMV